MPPVLRTIGIREGDETPSEKQSEYACRNNGESMHLDYRVLLSGSTGACGDDECGWGMGRK